MIVTERPQKNSTTITIRRNSLRSILGDGKHHPRSEIMRRMKEVGYTDYNTMMYYRDATAVNKKSSFVKDLITSNYSAYVEEVWNRLQDVEERANEVYKQKWTSSKTTTKQTISKGVVVNLVEETKSDEIAAPKLKALEIIASVQELKHKVIVGDNLQLSAAMLGEKFKEMESEIKRLKKYAPETKRALAQRGEDDDEIIEQDIERAITVKTENTNGNTE